MAQGCESAIEVSWHAHTLFFAQVSVFVVQCLSQKASPQCSSATRPSAYICFRNGKCDTVSTLAHNVNPYLHKPSCAETPRLHMLAIRNAGPCSASGYDAPQSNSCTELHNSTCPVLGKRTEIRPRLPEGQLARCRLDPVQHRELSRRSAAH